MAASVEASNIRNLFYKRRYPRLLNLLRTMIVVNLFLVIFLGYLTTRPQRAAYFTMREDTQEAVPIYAFDQPITSVEALLDWTSLATVAAYTFNYSDYEQQIPVMQDYFTSTGWDQFQETFNTNLNTVIKKKLVVTSVVTGAPVVTRQGELLGQYSWNIRMPILVTYESASETEQRELMVNVVVTRVPTQTKVKGIGIVQFYSQTRNESAEERPRLSD